MFTNTMKCNPNWMMTNSANSWKKDLFILTFVLLASMAIGDEKTAFVGVNVIDGRGGPPLMDSTLIIKDDEIWKLGPRDTINIPGSATIVDAQGKWVTPGLVDVHAHIWESGTLYGNPTYDLRAIHPLEIEHAFVIERLEFTFSRFLCGGVTSFVDLGGPLFSNEIRKMSEQTDLAPRMGVAGRFLANLDADVVLGTNLWTLDDPAIILAGTPDEARQKVLDYLALGANLIKTGFLAIPGFPLEDFLPVLEAITDEAHKNGARVSIHMDAVEDMKAAMRAGVDIMAHTPFIGFVDEEFVQLALENEVIVISTILVYKSIENVVNETKDLLEIEENCGDPDVIDTWSEIALIPSEDKPPLSPIVTLAANSGVMEDNLKALYDAGVRIAVGSDSGNIGILHGPSIHRELALMEEAGIDPMGILVAATQNGAAVFGGYNGGDDDVNFGTLVKKNKADFLVLTSNPLEDIANTQTIEYVIRNGHVFAKDQLNATASQ